MIPGGQSYCTELQMFIFHGSLLQEIALMWQPLTEKTYLTAIYCIDVAPISKAQLARFKKL